MSYNYSKFSFWYTSCENVATVTKEYYTRTASGRTWKSRPDKVEIENISGQWYENYVRSVTWFNTKTFPGDKTSCRAQWAYTWAGYIPVVISSVSPSGGQKIVARFEFKK